MLDGARKTLDPKQIASQQLAASYANELEKLFDDKVVDGTESAKCWTEAGAGIGLSQKFL